MGLIDALNIGSNLDDLWDESKAAWRSSQEGDLSQTAKHILGIGKHSLIEGFRLLDLIGLSGGVKAIGSTTARLVEEVLSQSDDVARFVTGLLRRTDPEASSMLTALFKNPSLKAKYLAQVRSLDEAVSLYERKMLAIEELHQIKITRSPGEVNAEFIAIKTGNKAPWSIQHEITERIFDGKEEWVRVYKEGHNGPASVWIAKKSELIDKSQQQIKDLLALDYLPDKVVTFKPGPAEIVKIRSGIAGKIDGLGNGGASQIEIITDDLLPLEWFDNTRPITEI